MILENSYASFVNLDHRKDRLERIRPILSKAGIVASRTRGILPSEYHGPENKVAVMRARTPGAIGCHYAQVSIMIEAEKRRQHAFVMEDDLIICSDFQRRMKMVDEFVATGREWDVIWLGGTFHVNPPYWHKDTLGRDAEKTDDPHFMRMYGAFCTYAYIVNCESLSKIIRELEANVHRSMGIDWLFIQLQPKLFTYAFVPGCITQFDNKSDIGSGMTVFSNFKKLGPYWYQDRLEDFNPTTFDWHEAGKVT